MVPTPTGEEINDDDQGTSDQVATELRSLADLRTTDWWRFVVWWIALQLADFTGSEFWEAREAGRTVALGWDRA